jgi:autotransporter translocation and assembly factor TamB
MLRRLGKWIAYLAISLVVIVIVLGLAAYLGRDPLRAKMVQMLNARLATMLNGTLEIGTLRGSLFNSLILRDVVLSDAQDTVIGRIDEIRVTYTPLTLLRRALTVSVDLVRPHFTVRQEADGTLNVARILPTSAEPPAPSGPFSPTLGLPFAVYLDHLQLHDGQVILGLPSLPGVERVENLQVRVQGQVDQQGMRVTLQQLQAQMSPAEVDLQTVQGTFQWLTDRMQVEGIRLQTGQTLVTATGVLPGSQQTASLELHVQPLDVTEIGRLLQDEALQGLVHADLQVKGPPDALQVQGQIRTPGGQVALQGEADTVVTPPRYQGSVDVAQVDLATLLGRAALQSDLNLHLQVAGTGLGPKEMRGTVQLDVQPSYLGRITIQPSQIHLEAQPQRFQVQRFALDTSVARMQATGAIDLSSRSALQYTLAANLAELRELLGVENLQGTIRVQGQAEGELTALQANGTLEATQVRYQDNGVQTLHLTYNGSQLGAQPQVTARLLARQARAGTLPIEQVQFEAAYRGAEQQVQFAAEVQQAAHYGGKTRGTVTLSDAGQQVVVEELLLRLADRNWRNTAPLDVTLGPQGVQINYLRLAHADEVLEVSGALADQNLHDVRLQATQIDLTFLQRLLALPDVVQGRATLQAQLAGTLAEPQLHTALTWRHTAQAPPFEELGITLTYAQQHMQGAVRMQQAKREVLTGNLALPINMAFTAVPLGQRLREAPISIHIAFKQPDLAGLRRWQPTLPALTGTLESALRLEGTYAALHLDNEIRLQRFGMAGAIEQVNSQMRVTADIVTAASVPDFVQAIERKTLSPRLQNVVLRVPALQGQLPAQGAPPQRVEIRDLVLQAAAQVLPQGAQATLQRFEVRVAGDKLPAATMQMAAQVTPQRLEVTRLQVRMPQSELRATGHMTLPNQDIQLQLDIPRLQLDELPLTLPPDLPRTLQGVIEVRGNTRAPQVQARLQYAGGQINADAATQLQTPQPQYTASVRLDGLELARLMPGESGRLNAQGQVQGQGFAGAARRAQLNLRVDAPEMKLASGLAVRVQALLAGDTVQLKELRLRSTPVDLEANGTLAATDKTGITYTLTLGDLTAVSKRLGVPLQAKGRLRGTLQGSLQAFRTQGTLRVEDWRYDTFAGKRVQVDFSAAQLPTAPQATLKAQVVEVQGPSLPASSLRLECRYTPQEGTMTVAVTEGPYQQSALEGRLALNGAQRLTLSRLRLRNAKLAWENAGPIQIVRSQEGAVEVQRLLLRNGAQELSVQGQMRPNGPLQAEVQIQRLQIQPTVQAVAPSAQVPDGQLSLTLKLGGTLQQPQIDGDVRLTSLQWQRRDLGTIRGRIGADGKTANLTLRWQEKQRDILTVQGRVGLDAQKTLALQLQIPGFDLALLDELLDAVTESAGILEGDIRVEGTVQQPQVAGHLAVRDGRLRLAATGERYKDIQARLNFAGNRIDITQIQVGSRSGAINVTGWIERADLALRELNLSIQANNFTAMHTTDAEAIMSTDLKVRGSMQDMQATGKVEIPRAMIRLDGELAGGPATVQPWQLTVEGVYGPGPQAAGGGLASADGRQAAPLPFLRADVQVDLPKNVWVRGPGTAVELSGDVRVTKELKGPFIVSGTVETVRGFASFYGKKFTVKEGRVMFTGSPDINPLLDVSATHTVSDHVITIHVEDKARQPKITLSSVPEVDQADIISLLVTGKTTDRLTSSEQNSMSSLGAVAGNIVGKQLAGVASQTLGLDTLEVGAGDSPGSTRVSAGRYVTQDLFLSYESQLGAESGTRIGVEYSINRRLKLKGSGSDRGESALDILWRLDY